MNINTARKFEAWVQAQDPKTSEMVALSRMRHWYGLHEKYPREGNSCAIGVNVVQRCLLDSIPPAESIIVVARAHARMTRDSQLSNDDMIALCGLAASMEKDLNDEEIEPEKKDGMRIPYAMVREYIDLIDRLML